MIPAEKPFARAWLDGLFQKGAPRRYSGSDLRFIGMPVSGICTGQVYLSGDGRLCHWDIFKSYGGRVDSGDPRGPHYADPQVPDQPFTHGFAVRCTGDRVRPLDRFGFAEVEFEGTYPVATVRYRDAKCPVSVELEAFSPFIPLNEDESGLPVVLLFYSLRNITDRSVDVDIGGWVDNPVCPFSPAPTGKRIVTATSERGYAGLEFTAVLDQGQSADGNGSMTLALLGQSSGGRCDLNVAVPSGTGVAESVMAGGGISTGAAAAGFGVPLIGAVTRRLALAAGETAQVAFAVSWHFPAYTGGKVFFSTMEGIPGLKKKRRYYSRRFVDSKAVVAFVASNLDRLASSTRLWTQTWYDSTLPTWFLDRTFLNTSILATQTCHRFDDGRFYGWEGVDSCPGTCQHVWQYAQAVAHVFPNLERITREFVDFGLAYHTDGSMDYRGEGSTHGDQAIAPLENPGEAILAADGMLGTIIRVYREHKMCRDTAFLERLWPKVRKSIAFMMTMDPDADGLLEGPQYNTLDATWYGRIPSISSLYLGALAVGRAMAVEMRDSEFASACEERLSSGRESFVRRLFNGEYFVHEPDPRRPDTMSLGDGCYIDQVLGQSFAHQIGYERVIPADKSRSALRAIWKYSFAPDAGLYRQGFKGIQGGRWYAMAGEAGIIMCTWPLLSPHRDPIKHIDMGLGVTAEAYFNECMNGFEYQVAAHMIAEGMVEEGLAVTRAIDDRYAATKRNPWNEVECGDHYSRSMASYGVFIAACGLDYHGPAKAIRFDPKIDPDNFRCAVILAEGWGTYAQQKDSAGLEATLTVRHGKLDLRRISLNPMLTDGKVQVTVQHGSRLDSMVVACVGGLVDIDLPANVALSAEDEPVVSVKVFREPNSA